MHEKKLAPTVFHTTDWSHWFHIKSVSRKDTHNRAAWGLKKTRKVDCSAVSQFFPPDLHQLLLHGERWMRKHNVSDRPCSATSKEVSRSTLQRGYRACVGLYSCVCVWCVAFACVLSLLCLQTDSRDDFPRFPAQKSSQLLLDGRSVKSWATEAATAQVGAAWTCPSSELWGRERQTLLAHTKAFTSVISNLQSKVRLMSGVSL